MKLFKYILKIKKLHVEYKILFAGKTGHYAEPGIERVQALADISLLALCCHSNETHAPTANPPNSAQLEGTSYHSPSYIQVGAVVWECSEGQTDRQTDRWP